MALLDLITNFDPPATMYLYESGSSSAQVADQKSNYSETQGKQGLHFQYWPQSLQDDYQVEYAEHFIPGGSHPLYQWVGGRGRTISFQAIFTSEIDKDKALGGVTEAFSGALGQSVLTQSAQYTVDVAAAINKLRGWMRPTYGEGGRLGRTTPPEILTLVVPRTAMGGDIDTLQVILRSAPVTYESWFPGGRPRIATVDLTFSEVVQWPEGSGGSKVTFIDRTNFSKSGESYAHKGLGNMPFRTGGL
jgi:hypothetical protein